MNKHLKISSSPCQPTTTRVQWIDIAKAYGMIAIVLGHILINGPLARFLYWWHIPIFFMITGIFLKPLTNPNDWKRFFMKRIRNELFLYAVMGGLLIYLYTVIHHKSQRFLLNHWFDLVLGGRTLNFYTSTFWFINVYILTIIVVTVMISMTKNWSIHLLLTISGLMIETSFKQITWMHLNGFAMMPWNMDTVMVTAFYAYAGYVLFHHNWIWLERFKMILLIWLAAIGLIFVHQISGFSFRLSLKSHLMQSSLPMGIAIIVIPIIFSLAVMAGACVTAKSPVKFGLPLIGRHTLAIMYGHKLFLDLCLINGIKSVFVRLMIGVMVPVALGIVIQKIKATFIKPTH